MRALRYLFFGTPEFAAIILQRLIDAGLLPLAVVTNPDRPRGRKQVLTAPPAKRRIMNWESGIKGTIDVLQPEQLDEQFCEKLRRYQADVFVLAAYGKILPAAVITVPPKGIVGVHPSLLPKYRGATPIQSVLLAGERRTGTTLFLLDEKVDHGPIITNCQLPIANDDSSETLARKLAEASAALLIKILPHYVTGALKPRPQDESRATYTKKLSAEDGYIDPIELAQASRGASLEKAEVIWRKVRALNPEPGVWTIWKGGGPFDSAQGKPFETPQGKRMKILDAELRGGKIVLKRIQFDGGKPETVN